MSLLLVVASLVAEIVTRTNADHPYDVPCVITLPIVDGNPEYLAWVRDETREPITAPATS